MYCLNVVLRIVFYNKIHKNIKTQVPTLFQILIKINNCIILISMQFKIIIRKQFNKIILPSPYT